MGEASNKSKGSVKKWFAGLKAEIQKNNLANKSIRYKTDCCCNSDHSYFRCSY